VSILRELENLLREIAEQQQPARPQPAPQPRPAGPRPRPQRPAAPQPAEILDAEVVDAAPVRRRAAVAKHVEKHLDTSDITAQTSRLGAEVGQADEKVEAHLHQKFDHPLSRIDDPDDEVGAAAGAAFATRMAELFRNPQSIQQAFILNEILNRPDMRW
jgi:hypothetical protein